MRGKPKIPSAMDIDAFISGGKADKAAVAAVDHAKTEVQSVVVPQIMPKKHQIVRADKFFRLRIELIQRIKEEAYKQSSVGSRVTETDIVEEALSKFFGIGLMR